MWLKLEVYGTSKIYLNQSLLVYYVSLQNETISQLLHINTDMDKIAQQNRQGSQSVSAFELSIAVVKVDIKVINCQLKAKMVFEVDRY